MKAIFVLLSVLAAVMFASAIKVAQVGNVLVLSDLKGRPGQTAKVTFKDVGTAAKTAGSLTSAFVRRGY